MSKLSGLRYFHLCWLAKPKADRAIYKTIKKLGAKSIVEIGMDDGLRSQKIIEVAQKFSPDEQVRYTGIDLFESRDESQASISLLDMHKRLNKTGAKVKLIPGEPESATARVANSLTGTDLVLLTTEQTLDELDRFWFFLPRMVHENSLLLVRQGDSFKTLKQSDWVRWTESDKRTSKAA